MRKEWRSLSRRHQGVEKIANLESKFSRWCSWERLVWGLRGGGFWSFSTSMCWRGPGGRWTGVCNHSTSFQGRRSAGAGGPVMRDAISRVTAVFANGAEGVYERALQSSLLVSADMAHAHHPNYPEKHDPDHKPQFHAGLVIKHNVNQRYATNAISATLFRYFPAASSMDLMEPCRLLGSKTLFRSAAGGLQMMR
jgi:hypothetical protein